MNRRQLSILIVLVVIIGGLGLYFYKRSSSSWVSSGAGFGQKLLGPFDINSVGQIRIRQGTNELNLQKKNDTWTVRERGDYPANFSDISEFIRKLSEMKAVETVEAGPSQYPRLELIEPGTGTNSGTRVEFRTESGNTVKNFLLGKKRMRKGGGMSPFGDEGGYADGRLVLVTGAKDVAVISDPLNNAEPKPEQWLDKEFFKIDRARSISLVSQIATNSWKATRESETNDWKLAEARPGEQADANKISTVANAFSHPSFADVLSNPSPDVTGLDKPTTIKMETFDGLDYTVNVGSKTNNENVYLTVALNGEPAKQRVAGKDEKPEEKEKLDKEFKEKAKQLEEKVKGEKKFEKWTYLVARWSVDAALKDRAQMMVDKPATNQTGAVSSPLLNGLQPPIASPPESVPVK